MAEPGLKAQHRETSGRSGFWPIQVLWLSVIPRQKEALTSVLIIRTDCANSFPQHSWTSVWIDLFSTSGKCFRGPGTINRLEACFFGQGMTFHRSNGEGVLEQLIVFDLQLVAIDRDKISHQCCHKWSESTSRSCAVHRTECRG